MTMPGHPRPFNHSSGTAAAIAPFPDNLKITTCHPQAKDHSFSFSLHLLRFVNCDDRRALQRITVEAVGTSYEEVLAIIDAPQKNTTVDGDEIAR